MLIITKPVEHNSHQTSPVASSLTSHLGTAATSERVRESSKNTSRTVREIISSNATLKRSPHWLLCESNL